MTSKPDEHERTMAFADIAFEQIKALHHSADPRNYEIWYNYATGFNVSLNQVINERLAEHGTLTAEDIEQIYAKYFAPTRLGKRLDSIGSKVIDKIDHVMAVIEWLIPLSQGTPHLEFRQRRTRSGVGFRVSRRLSMLKTLKD